MTPQGNACYDNRQQHQALEIDAANSEARRNDKTVVEHVEQADKHQKAMKIQNTRLLKMGVNMSSTEPPEEEEP